MMLFLFIAAAIGLGQAVAAQPTIAGHVTDAVTHRPVAGAKVVYCCVEVAQETDAAGAFLLHVEPAFPQSRFTIMKEGYATARLVLPGDPVDRDFELTPSAHLSGRLLDRDTGEPIEGLRVTAIDRGSFTAQFVDRHSGRDGSFKLSGEMPPGNYTVQANPTKMYRFSEGPRKESAPRERGYAFADAATAVTVAAGENRVVEIRLSAHEVFSVGGTIEVPRARQTDRMSIRLGRDGGMSETWDEKFGGGSFHIDGLWPGSYTLTLTTRSGAALTQTLVVTNHDVDDLHMRLRDAASIRATVKMLEEQAMPPQHATFRVFPVEPGSASPDPSDSLYIQGLSPGLWWPQLSLPAGYAVTGITYGGQAANQAPIAIEAEESTLQFTVTSRPAALAGVVRDANQNPVPNAVVVVSRDAARPVDPAGQLRLRARSDASGGFRIADLAPGQYIVTVNGGEPRQIDLDFGQTASVDLQVK
jgi:hypothetical protein